MVEPFQTFLVMGVALSVNVISSLARRFLTDVERTRRVMAEVKKFQREWREAVLKRDKAKEEKLRRKKKQMDQLQAKVQMDNLKVSFLFLIPFMALYWGVSAIVGFDTIVAVMPIPLNLGFIRIGPELNLFWWYLITSFAFSSAIIKAFGVSLD